MFGLQGPVSSASLEAWNAALQASTAPLKASSAPLQASTAPLEAWSASLEASGARPETSHGLIEAWIGASELPDGAPRRSRASLQAWNAALQASSGSLQASSGVHEVGSASLLVTCGTLQVRGRPPPRSPGTRERTTAAFGTSAAPRQPLPSAFQRARVTIASVPSLDATIPAPANRCGAAHAAGGTRTPTGKPHQLLRLARLPVPPRPRTARKVASNLLWA